MTRDFIQDLRYALRALWREPGFALVGVLTLGLGIGANTAIFSVVEAVLLRPLPYSEPDRLVFVRGELLHRGVPNWPLSPRVLLDLRERSTLIEGFAGFSTDRGALIPFEGEAVQIDYAEVTPNLFSLLGVRPALGRDFRKDDAIPLDPEAVDDGPPEKIVLSHRLWRTRFGADEAVVGRFVRFLGDEFEVIGVMPPGFRLLKSHDSRYSTDVDAWTAPRFDLAAADRREGEFEVIARLKRGVTVPQAQAEVEAVTAFVHEISEAARAAGYRMSVVPMHRDITARARPVVLALLGAVGFVLLIACANVSNLLVVRASRREGQIAIRSALGGSRGRLVRQLFTESLVLAGLGCAVGLLLARVAVDALLALGPPEFPRMDAVGIDATVLLFTMGVSGVAAMVFGTVPALQASRSDVAEVLKDRGRSSTLTGGSWFRNVVVVVEVALSVVLLVGAGLMVRSFVELQRADPGFEPEGLLTFELQLQRERYGRYARVAFVDELRGRLGGLPGVESVSAGIRLPLLDPPAMGRYGKIEALDDDSLYGQAAYRYVHLDYFSTMGTRLLEGRVFEPADFDGEGAAVVVVDEILARRLWPDDSAVGETLVIRTGAEPARVRVVGVVEHQRGQSPAFDSAETVFFNARHMGDPRTLQWVVRTGLEPPTLADQVRAEVAAMDPSLPVSRLRTMEDVVREIMAPTRFALAMIGVFAAIAAVLAAVGLYAVLAYVVRLRTAEIGVRVAFGARARDVLALVLRQGMAATLCGVALGLLVAFWLTRFMSSFLVEVEPTDPATFATTSLLFLGVVVLASSVPALRATRVDPVKALRDQA